jgi:hypothetical protein
MSKVTLTVDIETYWGYRTKRTVSIDPGIAWVDRAINELAKVGDEMDTEIVDVYRKMNPKALARLEKEGSHG